MPFVAHRDRSRRRWVPHRHDNRPFPALSQASTLPALRTSGELQRPSQVDGRHRQRHANGRQSSRCGYRHMPNRSPRTAPQRSMAGILSHRSVYRWSMLLGDEPPGIRTSSPSPASSYVWGNNNGRFDAGGRWTWSAAGNGEAWD